jgi:flagellar protein FliO/FliZ
MIELLLRVVISMAVVMGVMGLAARLLRRRQGFGPPPRAGAGQGGHATTGAGTTGTGMKGLAGRARARRARPEPLIDVLYRRSLAKGAWVTLVDSGGKRLLIGVTEQSVNLLAELPPGPGTPGAGHASASGVAEDGAPAEEEEIWLKTGRMPVSSQDAGSAERPDNAWKLALDSLRERTVRR